MNRSIHSGVLCVGSVMILMLGILAIVNGQQQTTNSSADNASPQKDNPSQESLNVKYSASGHNITPLSRDEVDRIAKRLDPETYRITQQADTERPFCGTLLDNKKDGVYTCVVCGLPLFSSEHKFNSGTGWPSFGREFDPQHVSRRSDRSHGSVRTEINCARCGSHLGHVFDDGPQPTGERHCLNSASLKFHEKGADLPPESRPTQTTSTTKDATPQTTEVAYFAGGCFWGLEHYFQKGPGVIDAACGYMQGKTEKPTYEKVCTDTTGHAETVKVVFDPKRISFRRLLEAFFIMHNPTQLNRQGPDIGDQYRSGIWCANDAQKREAEAFIKEQQASERFTGRKIVTQVEAARTFHPAEDYHQDYVAKTGRMCHVTNPW